MVPLQRRDEGPLVEEPLEPFVGVVVAKLLKGGCPILPLVPGVVEARGVHHHEGGHGEMAGGEAPGVGGTKGGMLSFSP